MHFVGKILVILVLILSIMFMAFAGVVYNAQISWRAEALKQKDLLDVFGTPSIVSEVPPT